jgi:large-conductance mechanosensitive channel
MLTKKSSMDDHRLLEMMSVLSPSVVHLFKIIMVAILFLFIAFIIITFLVVRRLEATGLSTVETVGGGDL